MTRASFNKFYDTSSKGEMIFESLCNVPLEYFNPMNNSNDCVIKGIMKITGEKYEVIEENLHKLAANHVYLYNEPEIYGTYLINNFNAQQIDFSRSKIDGYQFCNIYKQGKYLIRVEGHVYAVINGTAYDSWNPLGEKIVCAWYIPSVTLKVTNMNADFDIDSYNFWNRR